MNRHQTCLGNKVLLLPVLISCTHGKICMTWNVPLHSATRSTPLCVANFCSQCCPAMTTSPLERFHHSKLNLHCLPAPSHLPPLFPISSCSTLSKSLPPPASCKRILWYTCFTWHSASRSIRVVTCIWCYGGTMGIWAVPRLVWALSLTLSDCILPTEMSVLYSNSCF